MSAEATTARKRIDFDRLNHILIPKSRVRRERWRNSRAAKVAGAFYALYMRLSVEGRVFAAMAAVSSLFALEARRTDAYLLWGILSALLASSFLFARTARLSDVRGTVTAPPRITVGDEIVFTITMRNESSRRLEALRFTGPFLPWGGTWVARGAALTQVPQGRASRATLCARFRERGEPALGTFHAAALVPLGLTMGPALWLKAPHFLVVPRRANVLDIVLPRTAMRAVQGAAAILRAGDSRNFLGVRPYRPGDPLRDLHARTWARTGTPIVRQYEQEDLPEVTVILDVEAQATMDGEEAFEAAIEAVCGIAEALTRTHARLASIFSNELLLLPESRGHAVVDRVLDTMAVVRPGAPFNADRVLSSLESPLRQAALVLLVTLGWKDEHKVLQQRLRERGIACRALAVTDGPGVDGAAEEDVTNMAAREIRSGKPFRL